MSMHLHCVYTEPFQSKLGMELIFRDELRLHQTPGQELAYTFKAKKINSEIFFAYYEWLKEHAKDDQRYLDWHLKKCNDFFEKYGIDRVEFFVM